MAGNQPISGAYQPYSGQPGTIVVENPPFHPNILNLYGRKFGSASAGGSSTDTVLGNANSELYRGLMATRTQPGSNQQFRIKFLYNPATISESRSLDLNNNVLPSYARNPDDPGQYKTGLNATVNFSLLFDRTYELWDSSYIGTDANTYGVLADVNALYNMLNINQQTVQTPAQLSSGSFQATGKYSLVVQGTMAAVPLDLYFGYRSAGSLKYFGYVNQFDVTWTHFSQKMVPMRCAVNIGFSLMSDLFTSSS